MIKAFWYAVFWLWGVINRVLYPTKVIYKDERSKQAIKNGAILICNHQSHKDGYVIRRTISRQVCTPVYWEKTILSMYLGGAERFIEVGAGSTLTGLVKRILPEADAYTVNDYRSFVETVAAVM